MIEIRGQQHSWRVITINSGIKPIQNISASLEGPPLVVKGSIPSRYNINRTTKDTERERQREEEFANPSCHDSHQVHVCSQRVTV
jgi:hypothetical protein